MKPRAVLALPLLLLALAIGLAAQSKPAPTFADFGKWETLGPSSRDVLSPDGRVLTYAVNRSNRENELVITRLADGKKHTVPFGAQLAFSSDSKFAAYAIGQSETEQERLRRDQKPVQNKLGLLNLATFEAVTFDAVESFAFSPDGACLAIRPYGPETGGGGTAAAPGGGARGGARGGDTSAAAEERPGTSLIVRDLASGRETAFGNVSQYAWQDAEKGHLLAATISAAGKAGNGVQLFDPAAGVLRVLDSSPAIYTGLSWRHDAADLAVFRAKTDEKKDGATYTVLAWTGLGATERARTYDPTSDKTFPAGMRTVSFRRLSWSDDGRMLFLGLAKWDEKLEPAGRGGRGGNGGATPDQPSTIEIWHARDIVVMPRQKIDAASDRRRNLLAVWHLDSGKLVPLARDLWNEQVTPIRHSSLGYVAEWSKYAMNRTIGRPAADLSLVDLATGERTPLRANINDRFVQAGPSGKYLLFIEGDQYWTINLATRAITNITKAVPTSFIDKESDQTSPQKPPFGVAGWTKNDGAVLLNDKYDVWLVPTDGSKAERLTGGAAEQVRHRLVRLDPDEEWVDLDKPVYLSLFGEWTKKSGYARRDPAAGVKRLVWLDKSVGMLSRAKGAAVYAYVVQDFDDSPDAFVAGPDLDGAKQVSATNAFQADYAWGRSELLDYKTPTGRRLQASLHYPAGYVAGRKYPMIVYNYELLSQNVHRYVAPSDREYYNISVFTANGYFVLQPDIVFTARKPGPSVIECVTAGVNAVIQKGLVDPKRIGAVGHSMGGYNTTILATRTHGLFAAAVAGAPMTDLVSYYGDHHWGQGIAETDHIETGQERMVVPLYEDLQEYIDNSAVFATHTMTTPLLLEVGDSDGTVAWHQGIELYNIARRAGKNVVMLAYIGEDHGLRQKPNQQDYQRRILAWFGHYLKDEPAEKWITDGQPYLDRQAEIARARAAK